MSVFDWFKRKTILDLFIARDNANITNTNKILDSMPGALDALYEQMNIAAVEQNDGTLVWDDVSYAMNDNGDPIIILVGVITYPVGAEVQLENGDKVKLTESTAPYFQRLVRAGIPASLVQRSKEEVLAYLEVVQHQKRLDELAAQNQLENEDDPTIDELLQEQIQQEPEMTFDEFDLTQLTDEQLKKYQMGNKPGKA